MLTELRAARPLIQAITNFVSMDLVVNALLAIGASPAMVHAPEESGEFVALTGALVVNIGTLSKEFVAGTETAVEAALRLGRPWVLDPVGAGGTRFRDDTVRLLLRYRPTVIRGNASESLRWRGLPDCIGTGRRLRASIARTKPPRRANKRSTLPVINAASSRPPALSI